MEGAHDHEYSDAAAAAEGVGRLCCMCGDVGFSVDLRPCPACPRIQHTYCSRMYPKIDTDKWRCEWCLYMVDPRHRKQQDQVLQKQYSSMTTETMATKIKHKGSAGKRAGSFRLSPETPDRTAATAAAASSPLPSPKKPRQRRVDTGDHEDAGRHGGTGMLLAAAAAAAGLDSDDTKTGRKDGRASVSVTTRSTTGACDPERWRKPECSSPSPRVVGRRYKLLADVHC